MIGTMRKKLLAFIAALLVAAALFCSCEVPEELFDDILESGSGVVTDYTSPAATARDETVPAPVKTGYTMSDIYALENTAIFAKNALEHIFDGTINSKGKATGYHYSMVTDSKGSIIEGTRSETDDHGVFTAKVKVNDVKKNGFSSFYPESWTPQQVVDAINEAYESALSSPNNPYGELWIGFSGDLEIDMYLNNQKKITTAYPIYEGD